MGRLAALLAAGTLLAASALLAGGCTTAPRETGDDPSEASVPARSTAIPAGPSQDRGGDPGGAQSGGQSGGRSGHQSGGRSGGRAGRGGDPAGDPARTPVLATNVRSAPLDLPVRVAARVGAGGQDRAAGLRVVRGARAKALVAGRTGLLAVLSPEEVDASVQTVRVGGVDPLRRPAAYPLGPLPPAEVTTLSVVGDVMLGRRVATTALAAGDAGLPLRPMARRLAAADLTVGNLESTLSTAGTPTQGGDSFAAPPAVRGALGEAGFDVLGLANNHLGDFGPVALSDTVRLLRAAGLRTFGAGRTVAQAWAPAVVGHDGVRFGFLGFNAIGETPAVAPGRPGAVQVSMPPRTGPLDEGELARFLAAVRRLDRRVDVVVVVPHWGTQYTNRPEPVQWQVSRRLVHAGADVVVGGHPHWVQGAAMVGDALVVQSLGNFVFDMDFMDQTRRGLVAELVFWDDRLAGARFVPYRIGADFAPRVESPSAAAPTFDLFWAFSGLGSSPR